MGLNGILVTFAVKNDGIFLSNRNGACGTKQVGSDAFKFDIEFISEDSTASEDRSGLRA